LPLGGDRWDEIYSVENRPAAPREAPTVAAHRVVTPGYFELMGIRLRRGRDFNERDRAGQPLAVIVNESLARRHWPCEDPLGKRLKYGAADLRSPWLTVVGVVGDVKLEDVRRESRDTIYAPLGQAPVEAMALVIRSGGDPLGLVPTVREQIRALDRDLPVYQIRTMDEALAQRVWDSRFFSWLLATLAGLAVTLAVVGVYGVVSQAVAQRSREIGIRMALGASPNAVRALVMGQVLRLALAGVAAGLAASLALVRALAALMSEVNATDPAIFAGGAMLLAAAALAASYIPARKAMKLDPLVTLRAE
jgi:putative ABC transport system permease protein